LETRCRIFHDDYQACGNLGEEFRIIGDKRLELFGCLFDRIQKQGAPAGPYLSFVGAPNQAIWMSNQKKLVTEVDPYPSGSDVMDVLYRTMVGDVISDEETADNAYRAYFNDFQTLTETSTVEQRERATKFCDSARPWARYCRLCTTQRGYFGAVPEESKVGDRICMFQGAKLLFVVRPVGKEFRYIGHAYVDGLMYGEIGASDSYQKHVITLI
jgi:hypothetical protein